FAPQRVIELPSGVRLRNWLRGGSRRTEIIERIERGRGAMRHGPAPLTWEKREVIFRLVDRLTEHYDRPGLFEEWAVGLALRESLASTGLGRHVGLAHQFEGAGAVRVDCPPIDWWLFLIPGGIDWASRDGAPVHALIGQVSRVPWAEMD